MVFEVSFKPLKSEFGSSEAPLYKIVGASVYYDGLLFQFISMLLNVVNSVSKFCQQQLSV